MYAHRYIHAYAPWRQLLNCSWLAVGRQRGNRFRSDILQGLHTYIRTQTYAYL